MTSAPVFMAEWNLDAQTSRRRRHTIEMILRIQIAKQRAKLLVINTVSGGPNVNVASSIGTRKTPEQGKERI